MKTLVIHPKDPSTDFLSVIYKGKDWTVINSPQVSSRILKDAIKAHDRIIMLGHGTQDGLIAFTNREKFHYRYLIDSNWVQMLRQKDTVCIWCNADKFVEKYELKGFYTGMIISEYEEALMYSVSCMYVDIDVSNRAFAESIKEAIVQPNMLEVAKSLYTTLNNSVIQFNKQNLYYR